MTGSELIGDLAEGVLTARAVEPRHGERLADGHTHESACLNCSTGLIGPHCYACGQHAHIHKTLGAFFHDLLHGVFHFEGKIWRTVPMLAWHPGRLMREYVDGRRASYVSPVALFLFTVFLMFAVITQIMPHRSFNVEGGIDMAMSKARTELAQSQAKRDRRAADGQPTSELDARIAKDRADLATLEKLRKDGVSEVPRELAGQTLTSSIPALDELLHKAQSNPDLLIYKLKTSAYKYSWLLVPLSVPFVWLLFPFSRRFGIYDHTVFVTYSLCFMTLLVVVLSLWGWAGLPGTAFAAVVIPPLHIYRELKEGYQLGRVGALWRTGALSVICTLALTLFALAIAGLGLSG
ncbi:DUF3667 domain-containing protein [Parablastomonas sp. CN1-191]|uniref:DUF3667 domain-containing protein n=1 Tax=Parablastomonas sp. CN1-191 TaxID=3400908 RepID=UPI003BF8A80A